MIVVTLQRDKCIGCNYCFELCAEHFRMSKKDGKSILLKSQDKKGFHTSRLPDHADEDALNAAAKACPVNIIKVNKV